MPLIRDDDRNYRLELAEAEGGAERFPQSYAEALPRYLTALDRAFARAREASEFWFILALLRVKVWHGHWLPLRLIHTARSFAQVLGAYATKCS